MEVDEKQEKKEINDLLNSGMVTKDDYLNIYDRYCWLEEQKADLRNFRSKWESLYNAMKDFRAEEVPDVVSELYIRSVGEIQIKIDKMVEERLKNNEQYIELEKEDIKIKNKVTEIENEAIKIEKEIRDKTEYLIKKAKIKSEMRQIEEETEIKCREEVCNSEEYKEELEKRLQSSHDVIKILEYEYCINEIEKIFSAFPDIMDEVTQRVKRKK